MFDEVDDDGVEPAPLALIEITGDVLLCQLRDQGPRCIADYQKRPAVRIHKMPPVVADAQWECRECRSGGSHGFAGFGFQSCAILRDNPVAVLGAGLHPRIGEAHGRERQFRRVVKRHPLEQGVAGFAGQAEG